MFALATLKKKGGAMTQPSAASRYHHGDLRTTLLRAAEAHIALEGTERLSLRALAREAGVSATAPYRHFDDRQALLVALATDGFDELAVVTPTSIEILVTSLSPSSCSNAARLRALR